jgi:hypothetical protein
MDTAPDPALFVSDLQDAIFFLSLFLLCLFLFEGTFTSFFKVFVNVFSLLMEGSGAGSLEIDCGSGSSIWAPGTLQFLTIAYVKCFRNDATEIFEQLERQVELHWKARDIKFQY